MLRTPAALTPALLLLSGCAGTDPGASVPAGFDGGEGVAVVGTVWDEELVPAAGAEVVMEPGGFNDTTDEAGAFRLGPVPPGTYTLAASKRGYADAEATLDVGAVPPEPVQLSLRAVAADVPFHETFLHVALLDCSWAVLGATFPCVPIDRVTGQNITGDRSKWSFEIPRAGLADVLHEMDWQGQVTGRDMKVVVTEPNQPVFVGGVTRIFMTNVGGAPLRAWLVPGQVAVGGSEPFDGNESTRYEAFIRGSESNMTVPVAALYIEHRAENWFTFFYNRAGPRAFTALPDR